MMAESDSLQTPRENLYSVLSGLCAKIGLSLPLPLRILTGWIFALFSGCLYFLSKNVANFRICGWALIVVAAILIFNQKNPPLLASLNNGALGYILLWLGGALWGVAFLDNLFRMIRK